MIKITEQIFDELSRDTLNSWAIWDKNGINDILFFKSQIDKLHGKVVFIGLNRSNGAKNTEKLAPLKNFHAKKHIGDGRLESIIQSEDLKNLIGGFMTDLSDTIETDSNKVTIDSKIAVDQLKTKLNLLKSKKRDMICFGEKVFNCICNGLNINRNKTILEPELKLKMVSVMVGEEVWNIYRVWHYSNYGRFIVKSEIELPRQLRHINLSIKRRIS